MPDRSPLSTFPVTDGYIDAPDGACMVSDGHVIERHGDTWWVLGKISLHRTPGADDGRSTVVVNGEPITDVYRRRVLGPKAMRPRWRWCLTTIDHRYQTWPTRQAAAEAAALNHFDSTT